VSTLLLDTDVFSYLFKDHMLAEAYRPHLEEHILAISFMTVAELFQGAFWAGWGAKQTARLEARIKSYLVIPSSNAISRKWGEVRSIRRHQPISAEDAWIAATALEQDYPLVTHNARDFHGIPGLTTITERL
jgi:tRNA(fMet)-specific endonuclease VapC